MKISYSEYIKKTDVSVLVAEAIFSQLIIDYPCKLISDVAESTSGGTPLRSNSDFYNGNIAWLKSGELNDGWIEKSEEFISEKGLKYSSAKLHPKGTLLLAMYGATAGRTGITKIEASTNQAVCALFPNEQVTQEYLFWFLRQHRYKFIEISKGGAQPNLSQSVINGTKLPIPKINLQKQISELLFKIEKEKRLDISIVPKEFQEKVNSIFHTKNLVFENAAELIQQQELLKQLRLSFLKEAIQGKLTKQDKKEGKAIDLLSKIQSEKAKLISQKKLKTEKELPTLKEGEIPFTIPENWMWCRLGVMSINCDGARVPISQSDRERRKKIYDYYGASGVIDKIDGFTHEGKFLLIGEDGANLIAKSTPIAFIAEGKFWVNNHAHVLNFIDDITLRFMEHCLNAIDIKPFISGGFQPKLSQGNLNMMPIPLPPLEEQKRIVKKIEEVMNLCDELKTTITNNQNYTDQLLQVALKDALQPKEVIAA